MLREGNVPDGQDIVHVPAKSFCRIHRPALAALIHHKKQQRQCGILCRKDVPADIVFPILVADDTIFVYFLYIFCRCFSRHNTLVKHKLCFGFLNRKENRQVLFQFAAYAVHAG